MNTAYLLTGGNLGDRTENLASARLYIGEICGPITRASSLYETAAWGLEDQPAFLNQALQISTELSPRQLLRRVLKIEKIIGRVRKEKYGPRVIDIDLLMYNQEIHRYPLLKLPHPELQNRRFALTPLAEIAGEVLHPVLHQSINQLLESCNDPLTVIKFEEYPKP